MRRGKTISHDFYLTRAKTLDAGALSSLLNQGATIVIDFIDSILPTIGRIADAVADELPARVWVNLYATWGTESGLKLHSDSHDVIILQIAGEKHWTVYGPTRINPNEDDVFEAPGADVKPTWAGVLSDGDVLYIPRGWPHVAIPAGQPSLHLTISLDQPTGSQYFRWLADELDKNSEVRAAVPQSIFKRKTSVWLGEMRELVQQSMTLPSVAAFLNHRDAERLARPRFSLPNFPIIPPNNWLADTTFRLATTRRLELRDCEDGSVLATSAGRRITCPASLSPPLRRLSSNQPVRLDILEKGLNPQASQELRRTLAIMVQLGILFIEDAT